MRRSSPDVALLPFVLAFAHCETAPSFKRNGIKMSFPEKHKRAGC
jgi:hypothetical protein